MDNERPGSSSHVIIRSSIRSNASSNRLTLLRRCETYLDGVEFIDYGTDPNALASAFEAGEVDANFETTGDQIQVLDSMGLARSEAPTAATAVARFNVRNKPYDDQRVRNAMQLAVDNAAVLQPRLQRLAAISPKTTMSAQFTPSTTPCRN